MSNILPGKIEFMKMSGTGNDFIILDNRERIFSGKEYDFFESICRRKLSIGANGVILVEEGEKSPVRMRYYNRDGHEAEMCGNGARCTAWFARNFGFTDSDIFDLESRDAIHPVEIVGNNVHLSMAEPTDYRLESGVDNIQNFEEAGYVNVGVPHLVLRTDNLEQTDVTGYGRKYRNSPAFPAGANINFIQIVNDNTIKVRTYERGVETETLSCGTGCVAAALIAGKSYGIQAPITVETEGGTLKVDFDPGWKKVILSGSVELIYSGIFHSLNLRDF